MLDIKKMCKIEVFGISLHDDVEVFGILLRDGEFFFIVGFIPY